MAFIGSKTAQSQQQTKRKGGFIYTTPKKQNEKKTVSDKEKDTPNSISDRLFGGDTGGIDPYDVLANPAKYDYYTQVKYGATPINEYNKNSYDSYHKEYAKRREAFETQVVDEIISASKTGGGIDYSTKSQDEISYIQNNADKLLDRANVRNFNLSYGTSWDEDVDSFDEIQGYYEAVQKAVDKKSGRQERIDALKRDIEEFSLHQKRNAAEIAAKEAVNKAENALRQMGNKSKEQLREEIADLEKAKKAQADLLKRIKRVTSGEAKKELDKLEKDITDLYGAVEEKRGSLYGSDTKSGAFLNNLDEMEISPWDALAAEEEMFGDDENLRREFAERIAKAIAQNDEETLSKLTPSQLAAAKYMKSDIKAAVDAFSLEDKYNVNISYSNWKKNNKYKPINKELQDLTDDEKLYYNIALLKGKRERTWQDGSDDSGSPTSTAGIEQYSYLTDEEYAVYCYLFNTYGGRAATAFLENDTLYDTRANLYEREMEAARQFGEENPIFSTIGTIITKPVAVGGAFVGNVVDAVNPNEEISRYSSHNKMLNKVGRIREGVTDSTDSKFGKIAYQGAFAVGDMGMAALLAYGSSGVVAPKYILGFEAGNEMFAQGLANGKSTATALRDGVVSAVTEIIFEGSFDRFGEVMNIGKATPSKLLKEFLKNTGKEILEEEATDFSYNAYDFLINQDESEIMKLYQGYIAEGYNSKEAFSKVSENLLEQALETALVSAMVSGSTGGIATGVNISKYGIEKRRVSKAWKSAKNEDERNEILHSLIKSADGLKDEAVLSLGNRIKEKMEKGETVTFAEAEKFEKAILKASSSNTAEEVLSETSSIKPEKDIEDYPYDVQKVLEDYTESVDARVEKFVEEHKADVFKRLTLDELNDITKESIGKLTGNVLDGYSLAINSNAISHIQNRHGIEGKHDKSMKNTQDIARIPYIVNNFDSIKLLTDEKGNQIYSKEFKDKSGNPSQMVLLDKKINGTHYVAVAVPDSQWKKVWVVSSYINEKGLTQVPNDEISSLGFTSENGLASRPFSEDLLQVNSQLYEWLSIFNNKSLGEKSPTDNIPQSDNIVNTKKDGITQALNADNSTLSSKSSETPLASLPSNNSAERAGAASGDAVTLPADTVIDNNVPQSDNIVNSNSGVGDGYTGMGEWVYRSLAKERGGMDSLGKEAFDLFYNYGQRGLDFGPLFKAFQGNPRLGGAFGYSEAHQAYNAGFQDARVKREGGLVKNGNHMKLSKTQRADLDALGRFFKTSIEVVNEIEGEALNVKGLYHNGRIYVKVTDDGGIVTVCGHELTHALKEANPEGYKAYEKYVLAYELENRKEYFDSIDEMVEYIQEQAKQNGKEYSVDSAKEEIVANFTGELLQDDAIRSRFLESLDKADKNTGKIAEFFHKFIKKVLPNISDKRVKADFERVMEELIRFGQETKKIIESGKKIEYSDKKKYSIVGIIGEKASYGKGVLLDSDIFKGIKPRNWNRTLSRYVYNNLAGAEMTVFGEEGSETVYFAKENERVKKDGANNSHKVIDKLARAKGNVNMLSIVHIDELMSVSKETGTTDEHSHQWLDEGGWKLKKAYLITRSGEIYETTLNIAKARDGRNILYALSNTKKIDDGDVSSASNEEGLAHKHLSSKDRITQDKGIVNTNSMQDGKKYYIEGVDFNKQVDMALDKKMPSTHSVYIGKTPNLLQKAGLSDLPMLMSQSHMRDMNYPKDEGNIHWHGLSREIIKQIPKQLKEPVMIFDSISERNKENSICLVTSLKDSDGLPIIISIQANSNAINVYLDKEYNKHSINKSNFVTSAYGKNNFDNYINEVISQDALIYARKNKTLKLFYEIGLQLPKRLNNLGFDKIIHQSRNLVNTNSMQDGKKYSTEGVDLDSAKKLTDSKKNGKMSKQEYAQISSAIMNKNAGLNEKELKSVDYVYASDKFHVYKNHSLGDFTVLISLNPEVEYEKIKYLREAINNGNDTIRQGFDKWISTVGDRRRRDNVYSQRIKNGRTKGDNDRLHNKKSKGDSVGLFGNDGGDNGWLSGDEHGRYSIEGVDLDSAREIKKLRKENEELRRQFKETAFSVPDKETIADNARSLREAVGSSLPQEEVERALTKIYNIRKKKGYFADIDNIAFELAKKLTETAETADDTLNEYNELWEKVNQLGTEDAEYTPSQLAEEYSDIFDGENLTIKEMSDKVSQIMSGLKNENELDNVAFELKNRILDSVITGKPTYADKVRAKIEKLKNERERNAKRIKAEYESRIERKDTARRMTAAVASIRHNTERLSRRLNTVNSKTHIKESLREPIERFIRATDITTNGRTDRGKEIDLKEILGAYKGVAEALGYNAKVRYSDEGIGFIDEDLIANLERVIEAAERGGSYSYKSLTGKEDIAITALGNDSVYDADGKLDRAGVIARGIENVRSKNNSKNTDSNSFVYVPDIGRDVLVGKRGLSHGLSRSSEVVAKVTLNIGDILENSIKINELKPRDNTNGGYILLGIATDEQGNHYPVRIIVNNYSVDSVEVLDVLYAINAKRRTSPQTEQGLTDKSAPLIKGSSLEKNQSPNGAELPANAVPPIKGSSWGRTSLQTEQGIADKSTPLIKGSSKISVADLLEIVKNDFSDVLSNDVLSSLGVKRRSSSLSESVKRGNTSIDDLDLYGVEVIKNAVLSVIHIADYENKAFSAELDGKISGISENVMDENGRLYMGQDKEILPWLRSAASWAAGFEQFNPLTAFHIMGPSMKKIYRSLRIGFDKKIRDIEAAEKFMEEITENCGIDIKKLREEMVDFEINENTFTLEGYKKEKYTVKMSRAQLISLYLVCRQNKGKMHLFDENGGIIIDEIKSEKLTKTNVYKPTEADIKNVLDKLTDNEKKFADGISDFFMEEVAARANETSMLLYGYEKFNTSNYFPLSIESKSAQENAAIKNSKKKQAKIENVSYAKVREQDAVGAVLVSDILDVYTRYTDKMSSYSAFSAPLADLQRVMNYTNGKASVVKSLDGRFCGKAMSYINDFAEAVNGNVITGYDGNALADRLLRNAKVSAVGFKVSVALKQPTAMVRAFALMNPKDLVGAKGGFGTRSGENMYKYAPIARWKKYGFFDINTGRNMENIILGNQGAIDRFREKSMWLAGKFDEFTFKVLWGACERETQRLHPEITKGTEAFYEKVGERFSEVIDETQVVDSVFHRSKIMRSENLANKMFTAFQSEPKATYNLLVRSAYDIKMAEGKEAKRRACAKFGRVALATFVSSLLASGAGLGVQMLKVSPAALLMGFDPYDDEEDEEAWYKKWLKTGFFDDYLGMFQWWDVATNIYEENFSLDMGFENLNDFIKVAKQIMDRFDKDEEKIPNETWGNLLTRLAFEGAKVTGIPIEGFKQAGEMVLGVVNIAGKERLNAKWRYKNLKRIYHVNGSKFKKAYKQWLFNAYLNGDKDSYDTLRRLGMDDGFTASEIDGWVKSKVTQYEKEHGEITPIWGTSWRGRYLKAQENKEETEGFDDAYDELSHKEVIKFETEYEKIYNRLASEYGEDLLKKQRNGSGSERAIYNDAVGCFQKYAKEQALTKASGGEWKSDTAWVRDAEDICRMYDISLGEFIYLRSVYGNFLTLDGTYSHNMIHFGFTAEEYYKVNKKYNEIKAKYKADGLKEPKKAFLKQLRREGYSQREIDKIDKAFSSKHYWEE